MERFTSINMAGLETRIGRLPRHDLSTGLECKDGSANNGEEVL